MNSIALDIRRAVISKIFLISVAGVALAGFFGSFELMVVAFGGKLDVAFGALPVQLAFSAVSSEIMLMAAPVLCTISYTGSFVDEYNSRFLRMYLPRAGKAGYTAGKTLASALSGGAALFLGMMALLLIYNIAFANHFSRPSGMEVTPDMLITLPLFLQHALLLAVFGCFWSLVGASVAAAGMNKYLAYACPFVISYFLIIFKERYFRQAALLSPQSWIAPAAREDWAYMLLFLCAITIFMAAVYAVLIRWRLRDV